jgi:DNA polymerase I-like protein with 3'-5' exonuclease and polymerase domains
MQNQPPAFKKYLIADPDKYLFEVDLQRAESHVVANLCQDVNMMEIYTNKIDAHSYIAAKIFNLSIEEIIAQSKDPSIEQRKTKRFIGKKTGHAKNYGMGPQTFSDQLAVEEVYINQRECRKFLQIYDNMFPGLQSWHKEIDQEIYSTRILYNLFMRPRRFLKRIDGHLLRSAYAYKPSSTVAQLLNRGLIKFANDPNLRDTWLHEQVHDSVVFSALRIKTAQEVLDMLLRVQNHLTHEFHYRGRSFTIGADAKVGTQWSGNFHEVKELTLRGVSNALEAVHANMNG